VLHQHYVSVDGEHLGVTGWPSTDLFFYGFYCHKSLVDLLAFRVG
jgi:hypothetical protein